MKLKATLAVILSLSLLVAGIAGVFTYAPPATAGEPVYGQFYCDTVSLQPSTADQELFAAPGANYSWQVTKIGWEITTADADEVITVTDAAGTPIVVCYIATDTKGGYYEANFGDGVICSTNSAVNVEFAAQGTAEAMFNGVAYRIYNP